MNEFATHEILLGLAYLAAPENSELETRLGRALDVCLGDDRAEMPLSAFGSFDDLTPELAASYLRDARAAGVGDLRIYEPIGGGEYRALGGDPLPTLAHAALELRAMADWALNRPLRVRDEVSGQWVESEDLEMAASDETKAHP